MPPAHSELDVDDVVLVATDDRTVKLKQAEIPPSA